jgi:glycosyltransferase involved in cell wall biosynthesis
MSENKFTYSFVLLTYNQADTVAAAVKAALAQDSAPIEIVISDDCSTDETFSVIEATVATYDGPHQVVINRNKVNLGLANHIRRVHEISNGDVLIAAAGDDISLPHRSARIMEVVEASQPLLVCSRARVVDEYGQDVPANYLSATFYNTIDPVTTAKSRALYLGATGAWRRELFDKYGPLEPGAYEDLVMGFRAAMEAKIAVIDEDLVIYRLGSGLTNSSVDGRVRAALVTDQIRQLAAWQAVLRQRFKDAKTFGMNRKSAVWAALLQADIRARLRLAYYRGNRKELLKYGLRHPLLLLHTLHFERRRIRKLMLRARDATV